MTDLQRRHEEAFVRHFIKKDKQDRCLSFLCSGKHRRKFTRELAHFKWMDDRYAHPLDAETAHTVSEISHLLRSKGAGSTVVAISELLQIDGQELALDVALLAVWGQGGGTVLSCIPGTLAYFENEDGQWFIER